MRRLWRDTSTWPFVLEDELFWDEGLTLAMTWVTLNAVQVFERRSKPPEGGPAVTQPQVLTADEAATPIEAERKLARVLGTGTAVLLVLSCITPASSLFIIVPEVLGSQGSGAPMTILAGVLISVAVGACYAELGTRTASSGGEYAMVHQTLGKPAGWLTFALAAVQLWVIPPIIALGTADYLSDIVDLPRGATAAVVMLLATVTAILDVKSNAVVTGVFLGLEIVAAIVVTLLGLTHLQRGAGELLAPHVASSGGLHPFTAAILVSGLAVGTFVVSGFGTAAYLAEEVIDPRRNVARIVFASLGLGALVILVPTATTVLAVGDLSDLATGNFSEFVHQWGGQGIGTAVNVAIAAAILNAVIVMVLQNGRVVFASARDRSWPRAANEVLTRLHPRYNTPWVATLAIGIPGAVLAYAVDIEALLGITSVIISAMYVVLAVAALKVRGRRSTVAGWRMPLWPLPPLLVIAAVGYALLGSARPDVIATAVIVAAAMAYYACYLARKPDERFVVVDPADEPVPADV
jgi:amino acid transporter